MAAAAGDCWLSCNNIMARFRTRLAPSTSRRQRGVYAIELAFVFMIFFGLIYALVCYGILFTFRLGLQSAAEEGARAALRVRALSTPSTTQIIQREDAAKVAANNRLDGWLPTAATRDVQACVRKTDQDDTCPAGAKITSAECGAGGTPDVAWSSRCQIVVKVRAKDLGDVLPPFPRFALPDSLAGQASMLLDGRTL